MANFTLPKSDHASWSLSHRFNSHFPGEPGLAGFIEAKGDGSGGDNWSYKTCKAPEKSPKKGKVHNTPLRECRRVLISLS